MSSEGALEGIGDSDMSSLTIAHQFDSKNVQMASVEMVIYNEVPFV